MKKDEKFISYSKISAMSRAKYMIDEEFD